jgi:hypothetical protein
MDRTDNEPRTREPWAGRRRANGTAEEPPTAHEAPPTAHEAPPTAHEAPPPREEAPPPPPPPRSGRMDFSPFFVLLDALRRAIPGDMQNQFTRLVRETLVTIRGLIDWYLERLERPEPEQRVEDIPID